MDGSSRSKPCDFCNRIMDMERYDVRPYIVCPKARQAAIEAGEKAYKVKDKVVIRNVDTRTIIDAGTWTAEKACSGCGIKVTDEIRRAPDKTLECSDRFPQCLNSAPIVLRYASCPSCGQPNWNEIRFGVTKFHKLPVQEEWTCSGSSTILEKVVPGIELEELKKGGKDSSTSYQRFHHSTKCNGWVWRYSEDEWKELRKSIIRPFTDKELEETVYGTDELDYRQLKDPNSKKEVAIEPPLIRSTLNLGYYLAGWDGKTPYHVEIPNLRKSIHYKKMSLAETQAWHESRLEYRRKCYKNSILHPLKPKEHVFIDPYYKEKGKTNPDYYKIDSYKAKHRGYYKSPSFFTYGRPIIESDYSSITEIRPIKVCALKKELDFKSVAPYLCLPEATPRKEPNVRGKIVERCPHESTCILYRIPHTDQLYTTTHGVRQSIACQIYTPGGRKPCKILLEKGCIERDSPPKIPFFPFALISKPNLAAQARLISVCGDSASSHVNQNSQTLNTKKLKRGRIYPLQQTCNKCNEYTIQRHGLPRWLYTRKLVLLAQDDDPRYYFAGFSHGEVLCDKCQTVTDRTLDMTEYGTPRDDQGEYDSGLFNTDWQIFSGIKLKGMARDLNVRDIQYKQIKDYFQTHYKVYQGTADLYSYFIERSYSLLRPSGLFGMIISNKWMRVNYGKPLRRWLKEQHIEEIIDFGDLPVFESATTYPCILRLTKNTAQASFMATQVKTLSYTSLGDYVKDNSYKVNQLTLDDEGWSLADEKTEILITKIKSKGVPLSKYIDGETYYGIKTGLNEAFVIDAKTKEQLIGEDQNSADIIKPFLVGRDIKRYPPPESDRHLIFTRRGIKIENYPAIKRHLLQYKTRLMPKPEGWIGSKWEGRKPGEYKLYEIQDTIEYHAEFEKPKILWPGISAEVSAFTLDTACYYGNDNNQLIISDDLYLLGILNSRLTRFILTTICDKVQGGFYRLKIVYVEKLPIRNINLSDSQDKARHDRMVSLVDSMLSLHKQLTKVRTIQEQTLLQRQIEAKDEQIDAQVYELYGLTEEEIKIVEGKCI